MAKPGVQGLAFFGQLLNGEVTSDYDFLLSLFSHGVLFLIVTAATHPACQRVSKYHHFIFYFLWAVGPKCVVKDCFMTDKRSTRRSTSAHLFFHARRYFHQNTAIDISFSMFSQQTSPHPLKGDIKLGKFQRH